MLVQFCFLLSGALFASAASIGLEHKSKVEGKVVGGFEIDITQAPWQASVQFTGNIRPIHFCGASVISDKWLLTAAHCTSAVANNPDKLQIRVGSNEHAKGGSLHKVKSIIPNEQFNPGTIDYDFALLELEDRIAFNENVKPIVLMKKDQQLSDNTTGLLTGWGDTRSKLESSQKLRGAEIPIINQQQCIVSYAAETANITPRMLCAGVENGEKDACQRDSGGPLAVFDESSESAVLVGVVSWGKGCAKPKFPGVYARVTEARDWIYENTGI